MLINKAVLPIAGLGTRFLPVTKVIPKEMLPIQGRPILQILIEEAYEAGIREIVLIVNREKEHIIRSYFSKDSSTESKITEKGKGEALENLNKLISSIKFHYVYQEEQLGDGHAILQAEELLKNEPFVVLFGDDIVEVPTNTPNATQQLLKVFEKTSSSVLALEEVPKEKTSSYGIVEIENSLIKNMVEKPNPEDSPSNLGIIGKYIVTPEIFQSLKNADKSKGNETRLIDGFIELMKTQEIHGLKIAGKRYDTGTLEGYRQAILGLN